jgi:hypothetical protein
VRALSERLGVEDKQRYKVVRVLWGDNTENQNADESMSEAVKRMDTKISRVMEKLGLPEDKREEVKKVLYGESGVEVVDKYTEEHPE